MKIIMKQSNGRGKEIFIAESMDYYHGLLIRKMLNDEARKHGGVVEYKLVGLDYETKTK